MTVPLVPPVHIRIGDMSAYLPQHWNDLTRPQLLHITAVLLCTGYEDALEPAELMPYQRLEILRALTGLTTAQIKAWRADCLAAHPDPDEAETVFLAELNAVCNTLNFLFEPLDEDGEPIAALDKDPDDYDTPTGPDDIYELPEPPPARWRLRLALTRCPYRSLNVHTTTARARSKKAKPTTLYGPSDGLENLTIYELAKVFTAYEAYSASPTPAALHELLAILYRPAKPPTTENIASGYGGDIRRSLLGEEATIAPRARMLGALPPVVAQLIMLWVGGCRAAIVQEYQGLFEAPDNEPPRGPDFGWGGLLLELAGGVTHVDAVANTPWRTTFIYLSMLAAERAARKKTPTPIAQPD